MAAPYVVRVSWHETPAKKFQSLDAAVAECRAQRERRREARLGCHDCEPRVYGDAIDLDCADGLNADEREMLQEAGL